MLRTILESAGFRQGHLKDGIEIFEKWRDRIAVGNFSNRSEARSRLCEERVHLVLANVKNAFRSAMDDHAETVAIVTPEGGTFDVCDGKVRVWSESVRVADFVRKRLEGARWYRAVRSAALSVRDGREVGEFEKGLWSFAKDASFFTDESGNLSVRSDGLIAITPRKVDKSKLAPSDLVPVLTDAASRTNSYGGSAKPSIDAWVHAELYARYPSLKAVLHSHNPFVIGWKRTDFPFPCGTSEEAEAIVRALGSETPVGVEAVELLRHGTYFLVFSEEAFEDYRRVWSEIRDDWFVHMVEIGKDWPEGATLVPIVFEWTLVGAAIRHPDGTHSPRILEKYRNRGLGKRLFDHLREKGTRIKTVDGCGVVGTYLRHGFEVSDVRSEDAYVLRPVREESLREKREAESVPAWKSPIPFRLVPTSESRSFETLPEGTVGIPLVPHPWAFWTVRKMHVHEGVDLYCPEGTPVSAVEKGRVVAVVAFTGPSAWMDWWLDTQAVLVEGASGTVVYGEIRTDLRVGDEVEAGDRIGEVVRVLKTDKGRPTSMLHLELREKGSVAWDGWYDGTGKPKTLKDPTQYLLRITEA